MLRSVFQTSMTQPTPLLSSTAPGEPFGGPALLAATNKAADLDPVSVSVSASATEHTTNSTNSAKQMLQPAASDQVRWDRAWHAVTSRIQLPTSVTVEDSFGALPAVPGAASQDPPGWEASFSQELALVLNPAAALPRAAQTEDILQWHTQQVRQHFVNHVLPLLAACAAQGDHGQVLLGSVQTLEAAHRQYRYGLNLVLYGVADDAPREKASTQFTRDLHAVVGNSWASGLTDALRAVLRRLLSEILASSGRRPGDASHQRVSVARNELLSLLDSLCNVGLAGDKFQVLLAEVMDACMTDFVHNTYAGVWTTLDTEGNADPSSSTPASLGCMEHLHDWVENQYGRLAVEVLSRTGGRVAWTDVERWRDIAVGRLASLRINELFDLVLQWPASKGGLEDLRSAVATPQRRLQLTDTFSATLQKRLLHPGRSTLDILQTYISMIRTFHHLDSSKVLLDRVVHALQLYLCQRDDAIRIVVTGLLSNPSSNDKDEGKTRLVELAVMLNDASQQQTQRTHMDDDDLDWDDMSWEPDPVDAGPNYKRPKNEDVIGTLINALGSQEIFIKEFQLIIAERLLSGQSSFHQEIKVLSLLKRRFGEHALQNCDVMVKDIYDSRRVDALLRKSLHNGHGSHIKYHSKILSRLFWPSLANESFQVPAPVQELRSQYEAGFEQLKTSRKLSWLDQLGSATVQLELEDRTIELPCKTYEAAVIYAFQDDETAKSRSFEDLWMALRIDEDLLDAALRFWVAKRVLRHVGNQTYAVLERLDDDQGHGAEDTADGGDGSGALQDAGAGAARSSPRKPRIDVKEQERRTVYWQFIVGMLTNSSPAMPLGQIAMMMKMLIADGCPWSNEELQEFLAEKITDGELELAGGKYRLPKK